MMNDVAAGPRPRWDRDGLHSWIAQLGTASDVRADVLATIYDAAGSDGLQRLALLDRIRDGLDEAEVDLIREMRGEAVPWAGIAFALGRDMTSVVRRYRPLIEDDD